MKRFINSKRKKKESLEDGVNNYNIQRLHIEQLILSTLINAHLSHPMDEIEFEQYKIPFKLFKANRTHTLIAKAIHNLREENKNVDDVNVLCCIQKHTALNEQEYLEVSSYTWTTFDMMLKWVKQLTEIDKEEELSKLIEDI